MSISEILNSLEKAWERDDILLNLKKGLGTDEIVNEFLKKNERQIKELNSLLRPEDIDLLNQVEQLSTCESKLIKEIKNLLDKKVLNQFQEAISNREKNGIKSETTFIGINSAEIKNHEQKNNVLEVTVDFISEIISCNRDKNSKILTGDPEKVKKVYDTWRFSRNLNSNDPNWVLVETNI